MLPSFRKGDADDNATRRLPWIWNADATLAHLAAEDTNSSLHKLQALVWQMKHDVNERVSKFGTEDAERAFDRLRNSGLKATILGLDWSEYLRRRLSQTYSNLVSSSLAIALSSWS